MSNYLLLILFSVTSISGNLLYRKELSYYCFFALINYFSFNNYVYAILLFIVINFLSD